MTFDSTNKLQIIDVSYDKPESQSGQLWDKLLNYIQGKDQSINGVSHYIHTNNIRKKVIKLLEDPKINKVFILKHQNVFINFLYDELVKPDINSKGSEYKFENRYKLYMSVINSLELYQEMRKKFRITDSATKSKQKLRRMVTNTPEDFESMEEKKSKDRFMDFCKQTNIKQGLDIRKNSNFQYIPRFQFKANLDVLKSKYKLNSDIKNTLRRNTFRKRSSKMVNLANIKTGLSNDGDNNSVIENIKTKTPRISILRPPVKSPQPRIGQSLIYQSSPIDSSFLNAKGFLSTHQVINQDERNKNSIKSGGALLNHSMTLRSMGINEIKENDNEASSICDESEMSSITESVAHRKSKIEIENEKKKELFKLFKVHHI